MRIAKLSLLTQYAYHRQRNTYTTCTSLPYHVLTFGIDYAHLSWMSPIFSALRHFSAVAGFAENQLNVTSVPARHLISMSDSRKIIHLPKSAQSQLNVTSVPERHLTSMSCVRRSDDITWILFESTPSEVFGRFPRSFESHLI